MSDVDAELDKKEDEELDLEDQEQDLQDDAQADEQEQDDDAPAQDEDEDDDSDEEEEAPKPSRREQLRIQQLLERMKTEEPVKKSSPAKPDKTVFDDDDDTPAKTFSQDDLEGLYRFNRFETRLEVDAPRVEAKYPQLDKTSDRFNPVLASTINRMYLSFVGFDGKARSVKTDEVRYSDYVESVYELASEIAGAQIEQTTVNLKKQAAKTGVRPGGGTAKRLNLNKAPQDMTDEELEAVIKASIPRKR